MSDNKRSQSQSLRPGVGRGPMFPGKIESAQDSRAAFRRLLTYFTPYKYHHIHPYRDLYFTRFSWSLPDGGGD
jgi:hypothetical protein